MKRIATVVSEEEYKKIQLAKEWLVANGFLKPNQDGEVSDYAFVKFCVRTVLKSVLRRLGEQSGKTSKSSR